MALRHEAFTDAQLNGPKNVMGYPDIALERVVFEAPKNVFEVVSPNAPIEVVAFLKLAKREGAYDLLSEKARQRLEMYYLEGKTEKEIASIHQVSKQAISQTLRLTPESLYKKMTMDVNAYKTFISFREILAAYSDYRIYFESRKRSKK